MLANDYQRAVIRAINRIEPGEEGVAYGLLTLKEKIQLNALSLSNEAGEVAGEVKKQYWYKSRPQAEFHGRVVKELCDSLYHIAALAQVLGLTMDDLFIEGMEIISQKHGLPDKTE